MGGWRMDVSSYYANVHNNSGEFTYGETICGGTPEDCDPYISYEVKASIVEDTRNFEAFVDECGNISKSLNADSCNQECLVMWFNEGNNLGYSAILDNNSIFDIKNVDECEHIVFSNNLRTGGQNFEDSSYDDSGYPKIATEPWSGDYSKKYVSGETYSGHKIKYHVTSEYIPDEFYSGHTELVELYFPHMYGDNDKGKNTKTIGTSAFCECYRLSAITFSHVEEIKRDAFFGCGSLKLIDWGHSDCCGSRMKIIGESAFDNCGALKYINLPQSITRIDYNAFLSVGIDTSNGGVLFVPPSVSGMGVAAFSIYGFDKVRWDVSDSKITTIQKLGPSPQSGKVFSFGGDGPLHFYLGGIKTTNGLDYFLNNFLDVNGSELDIVIYCDATPSNPTQYTTATFYPLEDWPFSTEFPYD